MAVLALAVSVVVLASISFDSGVIGGSGGIPSGAGAAAETREGGDLPDAAGEEAPAAEPAAGDPGAPEPPRDEDSSGREPEVEKTYVIQDGDSFYSISSKFDTTIAEIQQLNPNLDPSNLTPGTRIIVP
ncbi:MAG: LysM peptidoglycan-binding domain-containing protein [Thermoleophilia bacterium]|nr:LysM peptidoglycan-binding domain-containing protein [Thermoleophilia bacterium]